MKALPYADSGGDKAGGPVNRRGNDGPRAPSRDFIKLHVENACARLSSRNERGDSVLEVIFFFFLGHAVDLCSHLQHQVRPLGGHLGLTELQFRRCFFFLFFSFF